MSLAALTRRVGALAVRGGLPATRPPSTTAASGLLRSPLPPPAGRPVLSAVPPASMQAFRWMSKKPSKRGEDGADPSNQQHEEWVRFQRSISVDGFETGQTKAVSSSSGKQQRGGKMLRRRRERETALRGAGAAGSASSSTSGQQQAAGGVGGQFPSLRYSDEETERLLRQAYEGLPPRAGKRGTRNMRRQRHRWFKVRQIRKKQKKNLVAAHYRKMAKRGATVADVLEVKAGAEDIRRADAGYQDEVLRRWAQKAALVADGDADGDGERAFRQVVAGER